MTNQEIRQKLISLKDEKYKAFSAKLTPGEDNIIGVKVPQLKEIAKVIAKGNYQEYLSAPYSDYHEECMLWGLTLAYIKTDITALLSYVDKWLPCVNNWAVCDCSVMAMKELGKPKNSETVWNFLIDTLSKTDNPYAKRFCLNAMFCYYLNEEYFLKVAEIYENETSEHYYIRMAIAWGMSVILVKNYDIGLKILQEQRLPIWTHNKSIQKAKESFRLSAEQKNELNKLKR